MDLICNLDKIHSTTFGNYTSRLLIQLQKNNSEMFVTQVHAAVSSDKFAKLKESDKERIYNCLT